MYEGRDLGKAVRIYGNMICWPAWTLDDGEGERQDKKLVKDETVEVQ